MRISSGMVCPECLSLNIKPIHQATIRIQHTFGMDRYESGDVLCDNCGCAGDVEDFTSCRVEFEKYQDVPVTSSVREGLWGFWQEAWNKSADVQRERIEALEAAANKLIDYCEDHDWGMMPEPFDSINPLLELLGRSVPIEGEKP